MKMKIAQIAPLIERVPPKTYGGTERVVHALTEELVRRGHDVTLFASGDSETSAKLISVYPISLREAKVEKLYSANAWSLLNIGKAYELQDQFDIIHDHNSYISLPTANLSKTPVVMTVHGEFNPNNQKIFQELKNPYIVTISKAQAIVPEVHYGPTIYNGLPMADYPFSDKPEDYMLYVGRISRTKGADIAIQVSLRLQKRLILAAKLDEEDRSYFQEYVEPYLSDQIQWIGEVNQQKRNELMSKALVFLHPITWREPFGLTLIEAMACGCPVVAMNKGSIPEIIKDGETGFVVNSMEEMIDAIGKIKTINRPHCREYALANFNSQKMAVEYEQLYKKILNKEI
jgi:glycosyltransferase involved in cell wall biosynthesis